MGKVRIYPTDKKGRLLKGFCPTLCESEKAERIMMELAGNLMKFGVRYGGIVNEDA